MTTSAAHPLNLALATALKADVQLGALLVGGKVYNLAAPQGSQYPYITLGDTTENAYPLFQAAGHLGTETIHVWSQKVGKGEILTIFGHLARILDRTALAVSGHTHVRGRLVLVATMLDPDRVTSHLIARYEAVTKVAA